MKRATLLAAAVMTLATGLVHARGNHPMGGCGLGYLLLSHDKNDKITQVLGATTNGTFGSQTFGISSGTSGCTEDGAVKLVKQTEVYTNVNFASLKKEMATGNGEFVNTFAAMLGASEANQPLLVKWFQDNYSVLFPTANTTSGEMLQALQLELSKNPALLS